MSSDALTLLRQTEQTLLKAVEAGNVIGLTERPHAARLAANVRSGRGLNADEARVAWRILSRNPVGLARAGLLLPGAAAPEPVAQDAGPMTRTGRPIELAIRSDGRIGIRNSPMSLNEQLKIGLYATFHRSNRREPASWSVAASPAFAAGLLGLLEGQTELRVSQRVRDLADAHTARMAAYERTDPSAPLPDIEVVKLLLNPGGKRPRETQIRGIDFATSSVASLLGFPMGGGKTAAGIGAVNHAGAQRGIIMCPNKVRGVWPREVAKWSAKSWHIVDGKRPPKRKGARFQDLQIVDRLHETEWCLFDCTCGAEVHAAVWNYEMLTHAPASTWRPRTVLDFGIYDEVHRLKSPTGTMSKNAAEWVNFTRMRIGLSGTPMPQHPWDIFGVYRALDPGIFGPLWTTFKSEFVFEAEPREGNGKPFPVKIKADKRAEFAEKVHSILYRPFIDLDLPKLTEVTRLVELEPVARREYDRLDKELMADLSAFAGVEDDTTLTPKNVLSRRIRLIQFTGGTVPDDEFVITEGVDGAEYRVSNAKEAELAEFAPAKRKNGTQTITGGILDEIGCIPGHPGGPEPVIVYCQYRNDLAVVRDIARRAGLRYGEISGRRSDGLTEASEMARDIDICGVQIQAGGTGVDLTRARYGVWYSKGDSVGDYDQARARQYRPGQTRPVVFIHLVTSGTIDEDQEDALVNRRSVTATFLRRRGFDPAAFGVADESYPLPQIEEPGEVSGGGIVLPIDEFGHDVMAPRKGHRVREIDEPVVDPETLAMFDLEDF